MDNETPQRTPAARRPAARAGRTVAAAVLAVVAASAAAVWMPRPGAAAPRHAAPKAAAPATLTAASLRGTSLYSLPVERWVDPPEATRERPLRLTVAYADNVVRVGENGTPQRVRLRSYNGRLVGPTIRLAPGDVLRLDLENRLPPEAAGASTSHMAGMGLNVTNLHTHGLHISPSDKADNVLREVHPGQTADYELPILPAGNPPGEPPMTHYPGTFWYHAHLHGTTAVQLASGMAGALLVSGDVDQIPEIRAARERIFLFQQLAFDASGRVQSLDDLDLNWAGDAPGDPPKHGPKKHTTINGAVKPLIELRPDQVERWRLIDAGVFELLDLSLRNAANPQDVVPLHEIAVDGITLKAVKRLDEVDLAPGYRADLLVKAPRTPGDYLLYKSKPALALTALTLKGPRAAAVDQPEILAVVRVAGESCTSPVNPCPSRLLPDGARLPAPLPDIPSGSLPERPVTFSVVSGQFLVNGRTFDPDNVHPDFQLTRGRTEEWILKNMSRGPHPFHIHVNAFQLVNADGSPGEWRDTVVVPPMKDGIPGEIRMRTRIDRFVGRFVLHCHILTHEDRGMMQLVEVKAK